MKKTTVVTLVAAVLVLMPLASFAADGKAVYDAKCKMCHGEDGKKLAKADLSAAAVQDKDDAKLVAYLTTDAKHKAKVADEATAKAVVTFLRTLKK